MAIHEWPVVLLAALGEHSGIAGHDKLTGMNSFDSILDTLRTWSLQFPDGFIVIGGVAMFLHAQRLSESRLHEVSHDGDFYLSVTDYGALRDLEEITINTRRKTAQILKGGVAFDAYIEHQHGLAIPFEEVARHSLWVDEIRCASLEHLLILKLQAALDRRDSAKGDKDQRDIVRILLLMQNHNPDLLEPYWRPEFHEYLESTERSPVFLRMAQKMPMMQRPGNKLMDHTANTFWPPFLVPSPRIWILADHAEQPDIRERTRLQDLCDRAGIPLRVTGGLPVPVALFQSRSPREQGHFRYQEQGVDLYLIDPTGLPTDEPQRSGRILEILAHGFMDYAARETLRGRFVPPRVQLETALARAVYAPGSAHH